MAQTPIETLGTIVYLMMRAGSYSDVTLADLRLRCLPAMDAGLAVTASTKSDSAGDPPKPLAYALFARVSDEWHEKLKDTKFKLSDFPAPAWKSGENQWLLDLVASKDAAGAFATQAAGRLFEKGSTLNIRLLDDKGEIRIAEKKV